MPQAARVGDKAFNPADGHGCVACLHPVIGPIIKGSPDVFTNDRPAARITDPGIHAACCGPNKYEINAGSAVVFMNSLKAARMLDQTKHCGGMGQIIEGSTNVIIGDAGGGGGGGGASTGGGIGTSQIKPADLKPTAQVQHALNEEVAKVGGVSATQAPATKTKQTQALEQAAKTGAPLCEECEKAAAAAAAGRTGSGGAATTKPPPASKPPTVPAGGTPGPTELPPPPFVPPPPPDFAPEAGRATRKFSSDKATRLREIEQVLQQNGAWPASEGQVYVVQVDQDSPPPSAGSKDKSKYLDAYTGEIVVVRVEAGQLVEKAGPLKGASHPGQKTTKGFTDVDHDGKSDIAHLRAGKYEYRRSPTSTGRFNPVSNSSITVARDTDHDGVISAEESDPNYTAGGLQIHVGNGSGPSSVGCQTMPPNDFEAFKKGVAKGSGKTFTYVLVRRPNDTHGEYRW